MLRAERMSKWFTIFLQRYLPRASSIDSIYLILLNIHSGTNFACTKFHAREPTKARHLTGGIMKFNVIKYAAAAVALFSAGSAHAGVIDWATWTSGPTGTMAGGVTATYTGAYQSVVADYPSWKPSSSYIGGIVGNAPPQSGGIIQLVGGNSDVINTIHFNTPVVNPVMAIWSLGQAGSAASFDFTSTEPFTILAGGPSSEYGGSNL